MELLVVWSAILAWGLCAERDPASDQLLGYCSHQVKDHVVVTSFGTPVDDIQSSLRVGRKGPLVTQDTTFFDTMQSFNRERIPERVVHAKGAGASGYFEVTRDISMYTKANIFDKVGKRTGIAVRLSTVIGESGSADTLRDPRGFAVKFYTEEGIWDIVGLNSPVFFMRDPMRFPLFIHSQKRNPVTNLRDRDMVWDHVTENHESLCQILRVYSDAGTPWGFRHMDGYGIHTFKFVNAQHKAIYVKFYFLTDQGIKNFTSAEATAKTAQDPDFATRDLYDAIAEHRYPSWTFCIQLMTFEQAEKFKWNPFDATKFWPKEEFPLIEVGRIVLDRNPDNYFAIIEQLAFSPGNLVPGIEASPDIMLQARMFSYADTQRYRLGVNFLQLPINIPFRCKKITNYLRNGAHTFCNKKGAPTSYTTAFCGPRNVPKAAIKPFHVSGDVARYNSTDEDNYSQCKIYWKSLAPHDQKNLVSNIAEDVIYAAKFLQARAVDAFTKVDVELGKRLLTSIKKMQTTKTYM
ncbi:catalase-like isoform X2 [Periplaneta americana]|uniref:catalase-like isoform X2 n=1 Tax=Periplaneta americana TaxID=6978 RepID=UPI0037E8DF3D